MFKTIATPRSRLPWLLVFPAALSLTACGTTEARQASEPTGNLERGLELYEEHCSRCHGGNGLGDGPQSVFLYPKPRNFALGNFRLTSTESGFPTDKDLLRSIRNGLPGSAMPPWEYLAAEDLEALVTAVKHLSVEGRAQRLIERASSRGEELTRTDALETARGALKSGPAVSLPPPIPETEANLARGAELYRDMCVSCHALEGGASDKRDMKDDTGAYIYPRNFRDSLLMRAQRTEGLVLTLLRGLPGTPMPSYPLPGDDLWALAYYVQSLLERPERAAPPREPGGVRHIVLTGVADPGVWTEEAVEVGYSGRATVSPAQIVIREGEEVHLELRSADVTHAFYSPELGIGPLEVYPGFPASLRFTAPGPGEYDYFCTNMCGHCHFTMKGTIRVMPAGAKPLAEAPVDACEDIHEAAAPLPSGMPLVEQGKALYRKRGCWTCHGDNGQGRVANVNALPSGVVPPLDGLAASLILSGPTEADVRAVSRWLQQDKRGAPDVADSDSFLRQYERATRSIREGQVTPPQNPDGPEPPLQMPAMEARLTPKEVDAVMSYLIDLYDVEKASPPIRQPIAFNHQLHVEELEIECMDCHESVLEDRRSGIPSNETCEGCHDPTDVDESTSAELRKVLDHLDKQVEVPWQKIHDLPDHTTFSHSRHVTGGKIECVQCHGDLAKHPTPPPRPAFNLKMSWCLDCHEQREASLDCRSCHS